MTLTPSLSLSGRGSKDIVSLSFFPKALPWAITPRAFSAHSEARIEGLPTRGHGKRPTFNQIGMHLSSHFTRVKYARRLQSLPRTVAAS